MRHINLLFFCLIFCLNSQSLLAQPTLSWVYGLGGTSGSEVGNIYQADSGSVYVTGRFLGTTDFDLGSGVFNVTSGSSNDGFLAKYDTTGQLIWVFSLTSSGSTNSAGIIVDSLGFVYITGALGGTVDFDPGPSVFTLSASGSADIFVAKYTSAGDFVWAKKMGGSSGEGGADIRLDQNNNVYVVGRFSNSINFDPGGTNLTLTSAGNSDVFIVKLTETGGFVWAKRIGGTEFDASNKFCVTKGGQVYVTGSFRGSSDFDPGPGTQNLSSSGSNDIFLAKYDTDGNYLWAFKAGSSQVDNGLHVEIAQDSNVILFTTFSLNVDFDPGPLYQPMSSNGITDVGIIKYSSSGDYIWAKSIGNSDYDWVQDAGIANNGAIYFTGYFDATLDMDPGPGVYNIVSAGQSDAYINKLDSDGNFVWAKRGGGVSYDRGYYLDVTPTNDVYYSGIFLQDANFDFGANDTITSVGSYDIFLARIANCSDTFVVQDTACTAYDFNGNILSTSGDYYHTYFTSDGCDSILRLELIVTSPVLTDTIAAACNDFTWRGNTYTVSGLYDDTLVSSLGCDSIVRLNLSLSFETTTSDTVSSCESYAWQGANYTTSGIYFDTLLNSQGCDSILELNLTINYNSIQDTSVVACDSFFWRGNNYTSTGVYDDSLVSSFGCDSVLQLNLTIHPSVSTTETVTTCGTYDWHGGSYATSGIYIDTLGTVNGCDSITTLDLTIALINTNVTLNQVTITADATGLVYQWINCSDALPISGETNQSFTATSNGEYAVVISENNCTDTSACTLINTIGMDELLQLSEVKLFPNPTDGAFQIQLPEYYEEVTLEITNSLGQLISKEEYVNTSILSSFIHEEAGLYLIRIIADQQSVVIPLLKE